MHRWTLGATVKLCHERFESATVFINEALVQCFNTSAHIEEYLRVSTLMAKLDSLTIPTFPSPLHKFPDVWNKKVPLFSPTSIPSTLTAVYSAHFCNAYEIHDEQTRQIWGIWKLRPAYSPETPNLGQNWWCFVPCDLEIWWMTLENNRAPLLCCSKLSATFHSHRWIQTGVAVWKRPIWVKFDDF